MVRVQQGACITEGGRKQSPVYLLRISLSYDWMHLSFTTQPPPRSLLLYARSLTLLPHRSSPGLPAADFCPNPPQTSPFSPSLAFWLLFLCFSPCTPACRSGGAAGAAPESGWAPLLFPADRTPPGRRAAGPGAATSSAQRVPYHSEANVRYYKKNFFFLA